VRRRSRARSGLKQTTRRLAGVEGRHNLGQVARVKQRKLYIARFDEFPDPLAAQRGDPTQTGVLADVLDLRLGQHAAVAHEHDARKTELPRRRSTWSGTVFGSAVLPG